MKGGREHEHVHPHRKHEVLNGKLAEKLFLTVPDSTSAIDASRLYAGKPHLAGSPGDFQTAKDFLTLLQTELGAVSPAGDSSSDPIFSAGTVESRNATLSITNWKTASHKPTAWIDVYYPVMNTPLDRALEILDEDGKEVVWKAELEEVAEVGDPDAHEYAEAVPTWHGLSKGGEVKGKLVYANYGRQEDYKALIDSGVSLNGTIVITRYGGIFRGLKERFSACVKGAQELGAAGVLIYSDPRDDGTVTTDNGYATYPLGPARNPTSVQRGSVQFLSLYPGDPTTPGYPSYENSTRTDGENIPAIPSLPISWNNAKVLLEEIAEGGKNRTVSLVNHVDDKVIPIWNTMGVIPGYIKDEVVVVGNHRDAWVLGATDPSSGTVSVHEVVRGLGALVKKGWKPLRTIVIASWDAEEYGLIGSTEYGEDFADFIDKYVVAYLNLDSSVSGSRFRISASPSLAHFVRGTAEKVPHPTKPGLTLWDANKDQGVLYGDKIDAEVAQMYQEELLNADDLGVSPLGSGSDFTVFLQRIGVASSNGGFGSTLHDPVYHYHSVFDSNPWQQRYGDPGFLRHVAIAKSLGLQALGIADSLVLPLNTTHYALELGAYLDKVESIASTTSLEVDLSSLRNSINKLQKSSAALDKEKAEAEKDLRRIIKRIVRHRVVKRKVRKAVCAIKKVFGKKCGCPHKRQESLTHIPHAHVPATTLADGEAVKPRVGRYPGWLSEQRVKTRTRFGHHGASDAKPRLPLKKLRKAIERVRAVNKKLVAFERGLIHPEGIKDREWYRHLGVAPGKWLGYGATTLPALTESFTIDRNTTLAKYEAERLTGLIDKLAEDIKPTGCSRRLS
ncbi:Zn-dependent exopeptidase [Cristinia sonorae]|uniref:Zn-dependent exopeptidase n=1 Tax=Cristinia sonorae TaxID=1940300 RepID=A0A8K0UJS6_9AGAR|nr:Zn-dependent exopeptidase [Cristinia sonorae]